MSLLSEAKQYVGLHARHMGLSPRYVERVLQRIHALEGKHAGSWVAVWGREADVQAAIGDERAAADLYNLARFPVADNDLKREAASEAARVFASWLERSGQGERRVAMVDGVRVPFLFRAGPRRDAPLVVLMGGIVSLKEQWGGFLGLGARLGCAIAIADFPGVGENGLSYTRSAARLYGAILDATRSVADSTRTLIVAPSFGGHLAMLHSLDDTRIQGIVTVGAPMARFFSDPITRRDMPAITRKALAHTSRVEEPALAAHLAGLALSEQEIASIGVPVTYVASLRDEIIPQVEWREAQALNPRVRVYAFDDVHGSPHHLAHTRLLILSALCRHAGRARLAMWLTRIAQLALHLNPVSTRHSFA